ncbi:hypothetical protein [Paenibacillus massiliensis]|uniref:hypothetical protein n=1 Tax=Paenibacillus massiliensis TaxID=225917 RepID=UPI000470400B|nr:hypothetical protein [Paenibacillus massiliensis]
MRISLQVAAGTWSAEWSDERQEQPVCRVTGKTELLALPTRESILNRLRGFPLELYQLLQGEASEWIKRQLPLLILEDCSCGERECRHATEALAVLEADPLLRLEAAGLSKAELLSGVFDEWARDRGRTSGSNPLERLAVDPSGEGRRGGGAFGEWIAEAAAEGTLHQPGPELHTFEIRSSTGPVSQPELRDVAALMSHHPKALQVLDIVRQHAAANVQERIGSLSKRDV